MVDTAKIISAAKKIDERQKALKWFEEYGHRLTKDGSDSDVSVRIFHAGSCPGADEATDILSAYAKLSVPDLVKTAVECCRNDIEIFQRQISEAAQ